MIVDELIVTLGLDARNFNEGQRAALDAFKKGKEGAQEFSKTVEHGAGKMADVFGIARKGVLGLIGAFVGGEVASMIEHIVSMDAATGRMAKTIGTSVENLGIWQGMVRQVGGAAEEATGALSALQDTINSVRMGSGMFDDKFGFLLNKIGGVGGRNADQVLRDLQAYFAGEVGSGRMTPSDAATQLRWVPGMTQNMISLLLSDFKRVEEAARKVGAANDATAEASLKLQQTFSNSVQAVERFTAVFVTGAQKMGEIIGKFFPDGAAEKIHKGFLGDGKSHELPKGSLAERIARWLGPSSAPATAIQTGRSSATDRESWIRSLASGLNIDPATAMRVTRSEGFNSYSGDNGTSFGDFQLHVTPGGRGNAVGDAFRKATGKDPSDPRNERAMDEFALQWASAHGWGDFHGAARSGIGQWQGIGARAAASGRGGGGGSNTTTNTTHIQTLEVNTKATDAEGIAGAIVPAIKNASTTGAANSGLQ